MSVPWSAVRTSTCIVGLFAVLCAASSGQAQEIRYVDDDAPPGGDGLSWATAYHDLQDACDDADAGLGVTEIRIAGGTYHPDRGTGLNEYAYKFHFSSGVSYLGGFAGIGAPDPDARDLDAHQTVLSTDLLGDDQPDDYLNAFRSDNSIILAYIEDQTPSIDGLIFRGRYATPSSAIYALQFRRGAPMFTRCRFEDGASFVLYGCDAVFEDCSFGPHRMRWGQALSIRTDADDPTPDAPVIVRNCQFADCHERGYEGGAAIELLSDATLLVEQSSFQNNGHSLYTDGSTLPSIVTYEGGAIYAHPGSHLTVADSEFTDNYCISSGGAIYAASPDEFVATGCTFSANAAHVDYMSVYGGGAIWIESSSPNDRITNCLFVNNRSFAPGVIQGGGAISSVGSLTIENSRFVGNSAYGDHPYVVRADGRGGAVLFLGTANDEATVINCDFIDNFVETGGGAITVRYKYLSQKPGPSLTVKNSRFVGNAAIQKDGSPSSFPKGLGGAVWCDGPFEDRHTFINCEFIHNSAEHGGALFCNESRLDIVNSTIAGNSAQRGGGVVAGPNTTIDNSILWGNVDDSGMTESAQVSFGAQPAPPLNHNCIQGLSGAIPGVGNIGVDPLFVDPDGPDNIPGTEDDDLSLSFGSPCIDTGDDDAVPPGTTMDLAGNLRVVGDAVDMGARESPFTACHADAVADGVVDVRDLLAVITAWGPCPSGCAADVNFDTVVNVRDLLAVLTAWGGCP